MAPDTALIEKREELKRRLAAGEYRTLVDIFLEWLNRLIQKITRQSKPLSIGLVTVILIFVVILISFGAISAAGDWRTIRNLGELFGLGYGLWIGLLLRTSLIVTTIVTVIVINQSIRRIFSLWRDDILDATDSVRSMQKFKDWLENTCNVRLHFLVTILGGFLIVLFVVSINSTVLGAFVGYGFTVGAILVDMFTAAFVYQFIMVILLPIALRGYGLKLFAADPANSELLARISGELGFFVYSIAVYASIITLANAAFGTLETGGFVVVLVLWVPIITMFTLNQTSLSSIVRRAKWKTLNEIQARVEKLQAAENFEDKKTMDAINRLLDYHERVNKTRISALDFRVYLGFINSLLLPLLAFLLGNLDLVLLLFKKQP